MADGKITIELTLKECKFLQKVCKEDKDAAELKGNMVGAMMASMSGIKPSEQSKQVLMSIVDGTKQSIMELERNNLQAAQDLASRLQEKIFEVHFESASAGRD